MTTTQIILIAAVTIASLGVIIELTSNRRKRLFVKDFGNRPQISHKNLRLLGGFKYKSGTVYYHCLCLGPFVFVPLGCYVSDSRNINDISSAQASNVWEICALYSRWGWVVAMVSMLSIIA